MTTQILKAVLIGALAGAALFFIPFPFRFLFIFLAIFLLFRFFGRRGGWWRRGYSSYGIWNNPSYAQRWHSMSDAERKAFQEKMEKELFANAGESSIANK